MLDVMPLFAVFSQCLSSNLVVRRKYLTEKKVIHGEAGHHENIARDHGGDYEGRRTGGSPVGLAIGDTNDPAPSKNGCNNRHQADGDNRKAGECLCGSEHKPIEQQLNNRHRSARDPWMFGDY
jgi:hypothetical protein